MFQLSGFYCMAFGFRVPKHCFRAASGIQNWGAIVICLQGRGNLGFRFGVKGFVLRRFSTASSAV